MSKALNSPFTHDMGIVPTPGPNSTGSFDKNNVPVVGKPATPGDIHFKFYETGPQLGGATPAKLAGPMGTAIPDVGHGFKGGK